MQCPKCGHQQSGGAECAHCGVVFAKAAAPHPRPAAPPSPTVSPSEKPKRGPRQSLRIIGAAVFFIGGAIYGRMRGLTFPVALVAGGGAVLAYFLAPFTAPRCGGCGARMYGDGDLPGPSRCHRCGWSGYPDSWWSR